VTERIEGGKPAFRKQPFLVAFANVLTPYLYFLESCETQLLPSTGWAKN
jgi:hypothetical protein